MYVSLQAVHRTNGIDDVQISDGVNRDPTDGDSFGGDFVIF